MRPEFRIELFNDGVHAQGDTVTGMLKLVHTYYGPCQIVVDLVGEIRTSTHHYNYLGFHKHKHGGTR
jgi:hypothetical protein